MMDDCGPTYAQGEGWAVVWAESRAEKRVAARLAARGIEPWLPTVTERHRWSDRWRDVVLPLFPGYLFARTTLSEVPCILRTSGVLTVVRAANKPVLLADGFVARLKTAIESPLAQAEPSAEPPWYEVDDEVIVVQGPLAGLRGVVRQLRGARQLVVWIEAVGRGVAFTLGDAMLAPAARPASP